MITLRIYGQTDTGKVRDNNQDSFRIVDIGKLTLGVVCDGMGGAAGGSTASNTACDEFVNKVRELITYSDKESTYEAALKTAVDFANSKVYAMANSNKELEGMGTTLCAVLTDGKKLWAVSVGDSRIYMFKGDETYQISHDHSYVQTLVDSGAITKEESRNHPNKNIITRAVGTQSTVECDSFVMDFTADGVLLCSDGLSNYATDSELNEMFRQYSCKEDELCISLIEHANNGGGSDNITALILIADGKDSAENN